VLRHADCDAYRVAKKGQSRRPDRVNEWAVSVRLNDGSALFWCGEEAGRQGQDWGRESQAFRFATRDEAEQYAAECATNSAAWEYRAVCLAQLR
jgi:hypothetical protein